MTQRLTFCLAWLLIPGILGFATQVDAQDSATGVDSETGVLASDTESETPPNRASQSAPGQSASGQTTRDEESSSDKDLSIGIDGLFRVGRWTRIAGPGNGLPQPLPSGSPGSNYQIVTRDGDGVEVTYETADENGAGYAIAGNESAPLIFKSAKEILFDGRFPATGSLLNRPVMVQKDTPWVVAIGDRLGLDQTGVNLTRKDSLIAVSHIPSPDAATALPDQSIGYDGVDWILINGSGIDACRSLSPSQRMAIHSWIRSGGKLFVCLGKSTLDLIEAAPWLDDLLPFEISETASLEPSRLEAFTSTQSPLTSFRGAILPRDQGNVLLMGRTQDRAATPMAVEYRTGFGTILVTTMDLDSPLFDQWPERSVFLKQILPEMLDRKGDESRRFVQTAYRDLAGQLRSTLDQFSGKLTFSFSILSLCILGLIAVIGPLDHYVINRLLGRPLLGWLTFPLVAISLSGLLLYQSRANNLDTDVLQDRRLELVDIDLVTQIGRVTAVDYLYSHEAVRFDQTLATSPFLNSIMAQTDRIETVPLGEPGETFGGIEFSVESDRLPTYRATSQDEDENSSQRIELAHVPLAPRSSKGLLSRIEFTPKLEFGDPVQRRPGSQLLQGALVNPLPVDLLEAKLIFKNWVYLLPTRVPAGGRVASLDALRQKNFRWQLTKQKALESSSQGEAWDPSGAAPLDRVAEILMFHQAAGGPDYTGLEHRPLGFLDLSDRLDEERCLLVGRLAEPVTNLELSDDGKTIAKQIEIESYIRIILPVTRSASTASQ